MSLEINQTGYVKYIWKNKFFTCLETIPSDQFKIDGLENISFNMGVQFASASSTSMSLWVKKSKSELASATIRVMVDNAETKVEVNDWKDLCYVLKNYAIPSHLTRYGANSYPFYEMPITCEIYWHERIKNNLESTLYDEMQKFYNSEELSDIKIIVNNIKIPAHKVVLSAHSPVFSRELQSDMKEAKEGVINITDFDSDIIYEMLYYCYAGETKASFDTNVALQMLHIAEKYEIMKLKEISVSTLKKNMCIDNVLNILDAADDHNAIDLCVSAIKFIVLNKKTIFALKKFEQMYYKKQELMFDVIRAVGDK